MKKKWLTAIIIYIALLFLCIAVIYVVPSVRGFLEKTYVTEYGTISISDDISGYIVRDEVVYVAKEDCKVKRLAEHNVLLKAGSKVVEMEPLEDRSEEAAGEASEQKDKPISRKYRDLMDILGDSVKSTKSGKSRDAGYISYFFDGEEDRLSLNKLGDLTQKDFKKLTDKKTVETQDGKCVKGEPVFKVTKNSKWYLVFYLDPKAGEKYHEGRTVYLNINDKDVAVQVARVENGDDITRVTLSCKFFYEGFLEERTLDTVVTVARAEGLLIKDSSIIEKDGQIGVLVKNKLGEHVFKPIALKADDGKNSVAYSDIYVDEGGNFVETIGTYDEIVEEPTAEDIESLNK